MTAEKFKYLRTELLMLQAKLIWLTMNDKRNPAIPKLESLVQGLKSQVARRTTYREVY